MTPPAKVDELRAVMNGLVSTHAQQAITIFTRLRDVGMPPEDVRDVMAAHVTPFVDLAADYTAQWYDDLKPSSNFGATAQHQVEDKRIYRSARWAFHAPGDTPPIQRFLASSQRMIYDGSRHTVIANADREGVTHFRNAPENACRMCRLLTVKPDAYSSPNTPMTAHDDDCQCLAVPARPGQKYRHPGYVTGWAAEVRSANTGDFRSTVSAMSRKGV